jgi:hypothetical protein
MDTAVCAALMGATPIAFVSVEALLVIGAIVAAAGAVITGVIAFRASRRGSPGEEAVRRAPSPSSLGMDDDPIVAALVGTTGSPRSQRPRNPDRTEP